MIWSVSTSCRSRTATRPSITWIASISAPLPDVDEASLHSRRGGHLRADQVGAAAGALASLEVAVRGRGAAFARLQDVRVHPEAGGATRLPPLETRRLEDLVEALLLSLGFDLL